MAHLTAPRQLESMIDRAVAAYTERQDAYAKLAARLRDDLAEHSDMKRLIHSSKHRHKDPTHLRDKLFRDAADLAAESKAFDIDDSNVFDRYHDLAGVRLIHLHTAQIRFIYPLMMDILSHYKYKVIKKPWAFVWDIEAETVFKSIGIGIRERESLYTSIHCVVAAPHCDDKCELQVRTLAEELWGEVSHVISYPHKTESIACSEQLLSLARFTSGCSRLVDSIFASRDEYGKLSKGRRAKRG